MRLHRVSVAGVVALALSMFAATPADADGATLSNPAPSGPAWSAVQAPPAIQAAAKKVKAKKPKILGTGEVGAKLTAKAGAWGPGKVKLAYQWLRDGKAVKKATKKSYIVAEADAGHKLSVKVTGSKKGYKKASKTSAGLRIAALATPPADGAAPVPPGGVPLVPETPAETPPPALSSSGLPLALVAPPATANSDGKIDAGWVAVFNGIPIAANEVRVVPRGETVTFAIRFADEAGQPLAAKAFFEVETPTGTTISETTIPLDESGAAVFTWVSTVEANEPVFLWWKLVDPPSGYSTSFNHVHINADATYNPSTGSGSGSGGTTCRRWLTIYAYGVPVSRTCQQWG